MRYPRRRALGYTAFVLFDHEHQVGLMALRNALGGRVRPSTVVGAVLQQVVDAKLRAH